MKDWIWRVAIALVAGMVVKEAVDAGFKTGYEKAVKDIERALPVSTPKIFFADLPGPKKKEKASTVRMVRDFIKSAKKSNTLRELITNPEDHSAFAYVEDGMIKIEIRNRMDH